MSKMIKCSTGGIENKIITKQELKPMKTDLVLMEKLKLMNFFSYTMTAFSVLFVNEKEKEDFVQSYFRENQNNIDTLIRQPANGEAKINRFTSKKILEIYKKNNE